MAPVSARPSLAPRIKTFLLSWGYCRRIRPRFVKRFFEDGNLHFIHSKNLLSDESCVYITAFFTRIRLALRISNAFGMGPLLPPIRGLAGFVWGQAESLPGPLLSFCQKSHDALSHHGVGHLEEAGDVGAHDVVVGLSPYSAAASAYFSKMPFMMPLSLLVHFLERPAQALAVLAHLQGGGGYAARVGRLAGSGRARRFCKNSSVASSVEGMLAPSPTAKQPLAISGLAPSASSSFWVAQGQGDVALDGQMPLHPSWYSLPGTRAAYSLDAAALHFLDLLDHVEVDAVGIVDPAVGIAHGAQPCRPSR